MKKAVKDNGQTILTLPHWRGKRWKYMNELDKLQKTKIAHRLLVFKKNEYSFTPAWKTTRGDKLSGKAPWGVVIWMIGEAPPSSALLKELEVWKRNNTKASSPLIAQAEEMKDCPLCVPPPLWLLFPHHSPCIPSRPKYHGPQPNV